MPRSLLSRDSPYKRMILPSSWTGPLKPVSLRDCNFMCTHVFVVVVVVVVVVFAHALDGSHFRPRRMMLLDSYIKGAMKICDRIGSNVLAAALQQFISVGASHDGDCTGDGNTEDLEVVWDELAAAAGDSAGASFEILHSTFDVR
eukprot:SAG22_NODE_1174_length_5252_cov_177.072579_9_plen_145_part_00